MDLDDCPSASEALFCAFDRRKKRSVRKMPWLPPGAFAAYDAHSIDTGERPARIETRVESYVGNGQPGRLTKLESNVNELVQCKSQTIGWGIGVRSVVSAVVAFVYHVLKLELNRRPLVITLCHLF